MVKIDYNDAFNSVHLIETCIRRASTVALIAQLANSKPSIVLDDCLLIESATGIQLCNPLGPLLFTGAFDVIARCVKSMFNVWYLGDATIFDDMDTVVTDISPSQIPYERLD